MGIAKFIEGGFTIMRNQIYFIGKLVSLFLLTSVLLACGGGGGGTSSNTTYTGNGGGTGSGGSTGVATLSWQPPTQNTDGSALTDLAGYNIYYGTTPGTYTKTIPLNTVGLTTYVVENLSNTTTYYFVITAVNSAGVESQYSAVGSKTTS